MSDANSDGKTRLAIPNGIILSLIGALLLITPLTVEIPDWQKPMDWIAGGTLLAGGLASLAWALAKSRKPPSQRSRPDA